MNPHQHTGRLLFPLAALMVIAADQVSKALAVAAWSGTWGPQARLGPFRAVLVHNAGVAFGLGNGRPALITMITLTGAVATLAAVCAGLRAHGRGLACGMALIAGGSVGNGADRVVRAPGPLRGAVVDWITVAGRGPVFNLADVALVTGTLLTAAVLLCSAARRPRVSLRTCAPRSAPTPTPTPAPTPAPDPGPPPAPGCSPAPRSRPRTPSAAPAPLRRSPPGRPARW
ncbi:signal peptidase II [Streptomyces sp. NBRC 110028]|uniref:signal peptidase II n=1 Tax=Streptomyces sp. NBRC 110028 TaxID=1621260 RepID=UPI0006E279D7|nr:signal peptidase II [Streptomyces sp. NBRC 110028]